MKVCVVGGSGNISTSIVRLLLKQGHEVTCFNRGVSEGLPAGARLIKGDRTEAEAFEQAMQREHFDAAIDMICFNADQARSDIRAFRGVRHFVMCSTVCTYGIDYQWMPVTEDHPLRPNGPYGRNKVSADNAFLEAYHRDDFPVTIIKPSTTYGPKQGLLRQITYEFGWIDRIRKGKPIIVSGDGLAIHQHLHVDDAALCFAHALGRERCIGQIYNMVPSGFTSWVDYHRTAMKVIGRQVEIVGIPADDLVAMDKEKFDGLHLLMAHNNYFSNAKLLRDVPEFQPHISLEQGMAQVIEAMDEDGRIPNSDGETWEDHIIDAQRSVKAISLS